LNKHTPLTPSTIQRKYYNGKTEEHTSTQLSDFYIYAEYAKNNHLNDDQTIFPNKIFDNFKNPPAIKSPLPPPASGMVTQAQHRNYLRY